MVLRIASRVFRPESYAAIKDHCEVLLGKALLNCDSAIENVWAMVCMYYWKDANDKRGDILIGFASRMAVFAEWNLTRRGASSDGPAIESTEANVQQEEDQERVRAVLCNIERALRYFDQRQVLMSLVDDDISQKCIGLTEITYRLGDCTSVSNCEMMEIARFVHESIGKHGKHYCSSLTIETDVERIQSVMESFNKRIVEWGDKWSAICSEAADTPPLQQTICLLYRDYTCLHFNIIHLHILSQSDGRFILSDQIVRTSRICFSSAFGVLQHAIDLGEMSVIYYLWDRIHRMIAYAAMLVPKLLAQDIKSLDISKQEAAAILDKVADAYLAANQSMSSQNSHVSDSNENTIDIQAQLLSAILARFDDATIGIKENSEAMEMPGIPRNPDLPWLEEDIGSSSFFHYGRRDYEESQHIDLGGQTFGESDFFGSFVSQHYDEFDSLGERGFLESKYVDAGLFPLDQPGILLRHC
ncbi:hypothetical protein FLONG3_6483 [Fusarium longipes]|uniref:Uncharacterized protein n=1 Tax=Fusarium longipes TaxID=694270 RepID=A0A395SM34_9HYPO|nr:hypothetical protein FLONG3_6483 [Fusarium longipes]